VWYCNNIADENKRAVLTSIAVPMANLMGVVSSNIFLPTEAPKYMTALATTAAFGGTGIVLTLLLGGWMIYDNRRRDRVQGVHLRAKDVPTEKLGNGPAVDEFRWFY
jgi:ABC-type nickel/cobalt efflux system permease component RcnA